MYFGRFSNKYSGRHGPSSGSRPGKKADVASRAARKKLIRAGKLEELDQALNAPILTKAGDVAKTAYRAFVRLFLRRR